MCKIDGTTPSGRELLLTDQSLTGGKKRNRKTFEAASCPNEGSSSSNNNNSSKHQRKVVRFDDVPSVTIFSTTTTTTTKNNNSNSTNNDSSSLWWTPFELVLSRKMEQHNERMLLDYEQGCIRAFKSSQSSCSASSPAEAAVAQGGAAGLRGLERFSREFRVLQRTQAQSVVQAIVTAQHKQQQDDCNKNRDNTHELSELACRLTRPSKTFARFLAEIDGLVAIEAS